MCWHKALGIVNTSAKLETNISDEFETHLCNNFALYSLSDFLVYGSIVLFLLQKIVNTVEPSDTSPQQPAFF